MNKQKYAFLDRDGTFIIEPERPEGEDPRETFPLKSADEVEFMDGAIEGMKALKEKSYLLVMVTNQTHLGTPRHPQEIFNQVMERIADELTKHDIHFDFIMVCPHGPDDGCDCRKPNIGGVKNFLAEQGAAVDLENSIMFGDRDTDEEFANNLSVRFFRIKTNERFELPSEI